MRTNMFGDPYITVGDDLGAILEERGYNVSDCYARFVEEAAVNDITPGWMCDIADDATGDDIAHLEGFETREALVAYCNDFDLRIER